MDGLPALTPADMVQGGGRELPLGHREDGLRQSPLDIERRGQERAHLTTDAVRCPSALSTLSSLLDHLEGCLIDYGQPGVVHSHGEENAPELEHRGGSHSYG